MYEDKREREAKKNAQSKIEEKGSQWVGMEGQGAQGASKLLERFHFIRWVLGFFNCYYFVCMMYFTMFEKDWKPQVTTI